MNQDRAGRSAERLARLYPRRWRRDYPDFAEVLAAELVERPLRARADVVRAATVEHLRVAGVVSPGPGDRVSTGLGLVYAPLLVFVGLSAALSSQLQTSAAAPADGGTPAVFAWLGQATVVGSALGAGILVIALVLLFLDARRRSPRWTLGWALAFPVSIAVLSLSGWWADRSGWYSPAAVRLPHRGVPGVLALWERGAAAAITPAWVHPTLFGRMPAGELAACLVAPVAVAVAAVALFRLIAAQPRPAPGRAHAVLAIASVGAMAVSLAASVRWVLVHPTRQGATPLLARSDQLAPGHTGWAVVVVLAVLSLTALLGARRLFGVAPGPG